MSVSSSSIPLRSWIVFMAIGVLVFLLNIDYTAVNLTLVPISEEIKAELSSLQWLLSAYVLVWAAFVIPAGRMADLYGKRRILIIGLILFMFGSCLTGLGHSLEVLISGRILQGFGAAIFVAPAWAYIFTTATPEKQGFVMGIILSFAGFGLAAGPTLAGFIIQELSWRWIFYINIPLGLIIIGILLLYGTKDKVTETKQKIDIMGTLLLAGGLVFSIYAIHQIEIWGLGSPKLLGMAALGVLFLSLYALWDEKRPVRMIPPHLFQNKGFMSATLSVFFISMNFSMVLVLMGLYLQNTLHYSSYETGLIFISMTISMGLLSPIGGKMIDTFGLKGPMILGALCTAIGVGLMSFLGTSSSLYDVTSTLFLVGTGLGAFFTAANIAMMRAVPSEDLNVASGVYTMFMMVGNTLSVILATSLVVFFGKNHLINQSVAHGIALSPQQHQDLVNIISMVEHSPSQLKDFPPEQIQPLLSLVDGAFVYGLSLNMMIGAFFAFVAAILAFWGVGKGKEPTSKAQAPLAI